MKKTSLKWSNFVINTAEISPSHTGWEPLVYFYRIVVHWITPTRCLYFKNCIYILRPETYGNELRADAFWNAAYLREVYSCLKRWITLHGKTDCANQKHTQNDLIIKSNTPWNTKPYQNTQGIHLLSQTCCHSVSQYISYPPVLLSVHEPAFYWLWSLSIISGADSCG